MTDSSPGRAPTDAAARPPGTLSRLQVGDIAISLFHDRGYDATTASDIAHAAGISRSTFFRQFRSKDDVIFADHDELLDRVAAFFAAGHPDPRGAVTAAARMVFDRFRDRLEIVRVRDRIVREVAVLRDRETVTATRYEKIFADYLRAERPQESALHAIQFAAAVTATHNFELRRLIRSTEPVGPEQLDAELSALRRRFGPGGPPDAAPDTDSELVVAVFPASTTPDALARAVAEQLRQRHAAPGVL